MSHIVCLKRWISCNNENEKKKQKTFSSQNHESLDIWEGMHFTLLAQETVSLDKQKYSKLIL